MKSTIIVFTVIAMATVCFAIPRPDEDKYTAKYDSINYKEIVTNKRLFDGYLNCILDDNAKCTPEGKELKSHLADALENECAKCTDKQKEGVEFVCTFLIKERNADWQKLKAKYDPNGKYAAKYEERVKKETGLTV